MGNSRQEKKDRPIQTPMKLLHVLYMDMYVGMCKNTIQERALRAWVDTVSEPRMTRVFSWTRRVESRDDDVWFLVMIFIFVG